MKYYFEDLSKTFTTVQFLRVDVDELSDVSHWANITALPSYVLYKDGRKINEVIGADKEKLLQMLWKYA